MKPFILISFLCYSVSLNAQDSLKTNVTAKAGGNIGATTATAAKVAGASLTQVKPTIKPAAPKKVVPVKTFPPRKKVIDLSFSYRYYQLYKDKGGFDSSRLWNDAKLKKTFNNKGIIQHNISKNTLKWKLKGEDDNEYYNIVSIVGDSYAKTIGGIRYFRFKDEELGPSVACFYPEQSIWIIYRQNVRPATK